jgi:hypothetical protein
MKALFLFTALAAQAGLTLAAEQAAGTSAHVHQPGMDMSAPSAQANSNGSGATAPAAPDAGPTDHSKMNHGAMSMDMKMQKDESMQHDMAGMHEMHDMQGILGGYPMTRDASGTSWQPDSSRHDGMHAMVGEWSTMVHGFANLVYDRQSGPRGDTKTFSQSMLMIMGQRSLGSGTFGLRGMFSLDPLMGKSGYPELFQTGESANGVTPLIDRQHPHDLAMELAVTYSMPLSADSSVFGYVGLPGEPALGPPAFMHRFSGVDNPEAPITHHWLDSTHITYGVTTLGYVYRNWKLEASAFHGREPDQLRYNIETGPLDSRSARLSWNPTPNWSGQISHGHLRSPEALEPAIDVNRTTASVTHNLPMSGNTLQTTVAWGRNRPSQGQTTNGYLLESALSVGPSHTFFGRAERVDKNELFLDGEPLHDRNFKINKASLGYVYDFPTSSHYRIGIGGVVSRFSIPDTLSSTYGSNPNSAMVFVRLKIQ